MNNNTNNTDNTEIIQKRNININKSKLFDKIGILDVEGNNINPFTNEPYKNIYFDSSKEISDSNPTYQFLSNIWSNFPMYKVKEEAIKLLYENQVILIISGTGSGKTVLTPKFLLHVLNYQGKIGITNPKRPPTKENAKYAAKTLDVKLGEEVGTKYRGSDSSLYSASKSKLIYTTDGYIRARLKNDPLLLDFDAIIIDEAHERNVQIDMILLLLKDVIKLRPKFKLVIMSATVNEKIFKDYFPENEFKFGFLDAGSETHYEVKEYFLEEFTNFKKPINKFDKNGNLENDAYIEVAVDTAIKILTTTDEGDILVFFTGSKEIQMGCQLLDSKLSKINKNRSNKVLCGSLSAGTEDEMKNILINAKKYKENGRYNRKIVFATEVVESSITIKGIDYVIDSGLKNNDMFYSKKNLNALERKYISKASHRQRKGRTGRIQPGFCYNLFTKEEYEKFLDYPLPPIKTEDISDSILQFIADREKVSHINFPFSYDIDGGDKKKKTKLILKNNSKEIHKIFQPVSLNKFLLKLIEAPPIDTVKRILHRLFALGVIEINEGIGKITDLGRAIAVFDTYPEIGKMLISGYNYHCRDEIITLAAIYTNENFKYKMDSIFRKFKTNTKDEKEKEREKKEYDRIKKKWVNSMGDPFSILDIYKAFYERNYDTVDRRTGRIIKEKKGEAKQWCKDNYLSYNILESVKQDSKDFNRKFGKVVSIFREKHPENRPTNLFLESPPILSEKKEENILMAILDAYYINLMKKLGDKKFTNCFPPEKSIAGLAIDSLFKNVKSKYTYAVYTELKSIFGRESYSIITKVPLSFVEKLKISKEGEILEDCFKKVKTEKKERQTSKKRQTTRKRRSSKKRYRRRSRSKKSRK